jgi:PAS domain S-box-containing protein
MAHVTPASATVQKNGPDGGGQKLARSLQARILGHRMSLSSSAADLPLGGPLAGPASGPDGVLDVKSWVGFKPVILVLGDHPALLRSYGRILGKLDVTVLLQTDPHEALDLVHNHKLDVVISELRMPGMSGEAFLAQVRQLRPDAVRVLSAAYVDSVMMDSVIRRCGIFRFIIKPCSPSLLRSTVMEAIELCSRIRTRRTRELKLELDLKSYKQLFDDALDPMMVADLEGNLLQVNAAFRQAHGCTGGDFRRAHPSIMSGLDREPEWPAILVQLQTTGQWSGEVRHLKRDVYSLLSLSLIADEEGTPQVISAVEKDITTRKKLEQQTYAAQYEVTLGLAKLAEYRDPETGAHLDRMRSYCEILARQMARLPRYRGIIDADYVEAITVASPLHDIGKVGIPDSILLKPGKLDPEEWAVMQQHTLIGAEVLSSTGHSLPGKTWLEMARTIARQHHERFDGTGYPAGLAGEEIDLAARIVTLADAYDCMISRRVYKDAYPAERARELIIEGSGTQFDPDVVQAFLQTEAQLREVREQLADSGAADPATAGEGEAGTLERIQQLLAPRALNR